MTGVEDPVAQAVTENSSVAGVFRGKSLIIIAVICVLGSLLIWKGTEYYASRKEEEFLSTCKRLTVQKDWQQLKKTATLWNEWNPSSNDSRIYLAEACVQQGELTDAADLLQSVSDDYHGALEALAMSGEILFNDLNRPFEAETVWKRMLRIDKRAVLAHQRLIYLYAMTLQRGRLYDQILDAIKIGSEPREAYSYLLLTSDLNFSNGLALTTRWRSNDPDNELLEVIQAVYAAKTTRDNYLPKFGSSTVTPGDRALLDRCLEEYPANPEAVALAIEQAMFDGEDDRVKDLLGQVDERASNDGRFWRYRGWFLSTRAQFDSAVDALNKCLEINPFEWKARLLLADVYRKSGDTSKAARESELALIGKDLQSRILQSPNARELDEGLVVEIYEYVSLTGPSFVAEALGRRLGM